MKVGQESTLIIFSFYNPENRPEAYILKPYYLHWFHRILQNNIAMVPELTPLVSR